MEDMEAISTETVSQGFVFIYNYPYCAFSRIFRRKANKGNILYEQYGVGGKDNGKSLHTVLDGGQGKVHSLGKKSRSREQYRKL